MNNYFKISGLQVIKKPKKTTKTNLQKRNASLNRNLLETYSTTGCPHLSMTLTTFSMLKQIIQFENQPRIIHIIT